MFTVEIPIALLCGLGAMIFAVGLVTGIVTMFMAKPATPKQVQKLQTTAEQCAGKCTACICDELERVA